MRDVKPLLADCRVRLGVEATDDPASLAEMSRDFGGIASRRPGLVLRPRTPEEVARVVRYAAQRGLPVSARGTAHSQGGQSLSDGGLLLDLRGLDAVEEVNAREGWVQMGAGASWREVVGAVTPHGLLPPVLTDNLRVTVGGTLAVGGVGPASFRHGLQAGHCAAFEVVTGAGELLWCSPEAQPELFAGVPCSLGQLGIVTRVRHRLRPFRPRTHTWRLLYRDLGRFLADLRLCATELPADAVDAWALPDGSGGRSFQLCVSVETDAGLAPAVLPALSCDCRLATTEQPTAGFASRLDPWFDRLSGETGEGRAHPWVETFVPWTCAASYVERILPLCGDAPLLLWPVYTGGQHLPMLMAPAGDLALLVGVLASLSPEDVEDTLPRLRRIGELGAEARGKRYLSGWLGFGLEQWRNHYGAQWERVVQLKRTCDPKRILNRCMIAL